MTRRRSNGGNQTLAASRERRGGWYAPIIGRDKSRRGACGVGRLVTMFIRAANGVRSWKYPFVFYAGRDSCFESVD